MAERVRAGVVRDVLVLIVLLVAYGALVAHFDFLADDAFISFRYADNLAHGNGLRFNIGEDPPVEGFSNFLWVLALAFFAKLGLSPLVVSRVLATVCGAILIVAVYFRSGFLFGQNRARAFIAAASLVTLPPFAAWSTGGLETVPYALALFLLFTELIIGDGAFSVGRAGALGLVVILLRPEGIAHAVLSGTVAALYFFVAGLENDWRGRMARYARAIALGFLVLTLFRSIYFRSLLPNTYYAKVGFTGEQLIRGAQYVAHFLLSYPGALVVGIAACVYLIKLKKDVLAAVALLYLSLLVIPVFLGGDFMAMARFMVPALPFLSIFFAGLVLPRAREKGAKLRPLAIALCLGVFAADVLPAFEVHTVPASWRAWVNSRWGKIYMCDRAYWREMKLNTERFALIGKTIGSMAAPGESIVTGAIGAIGYYSGMRVHDIYGLVDREVARSKMAREARPAGHDKSVDAFYFYRKYEPTYINPRFVPLANVETWRMKLSRTIADRSKSSSVPYFREYYNRFREEYELIIIPVYFDYKGEKLVLLTFKKKAAGS